MASPLNVRHLADLAIRLNALGITVHDVEWHSGAWFIIVEKNGVNLEVSWGGADDESIAISRLLRASSTGVEYWDKPESISIPSGAAAPDHVMSRAEHEIVARLPDA